MKPLTAEHAAWYIAKHIRNEKGEPLRMFPWWLEALEAYFDPRYRVLLVNTIRQQGKTQLCMALIMYLMFVARDMFIVAITNAEDQMRRFVDQKISRPLLHMDSVFSDKRGGMYVTGSEVRVESRRNVLKVMPANKATATGTSPDLVFFDECRDAPDDLFEELAPSVMTSGGKLLLASTAGAPRGFFYEMVAAKEARPAEHADWFLFRSKEVINDRTNVADLRKIMSLGSRAGELRNLNNEFAEEGDELLDRDVIDHAQNDELASAVAADALIKDKTGRVVATHDCFGFLDISVKTDLTSLVVVGRPSDMPERLRVLRVTAWDPTKLPGGRINYALVQQEVEFVLRAFRLRRLLIDTTSGGGGELVTWAKQRGFWQVEEHHATAAKNQEMWGRLRDLLNERRLKIPQHDRLVQELRGLKTQPYNFGVGFRVIDASKQLHRDISVSLAGAAWIASEAQGRGEAKVFDARTLFRRTA